MKLTDVVAQHGFQPSDLGEIHKAKLYERQNQDGTLDLLCVQKIGNVWRVDRIILLNLMGGFIPVGEPLHNIIIPKDELEGYLNTILKTAPEPVAA